MSRFRISALCRPAWLVAPLAMLAGSLLAVTEAVGQKRPTGGRSPFVFKDVGEEAGLFPHAAGIKGHGAGWGDVDGNGWIDLYVATFHTEEGTKPNMLFRNEGGKFRLDEQKELQVSMRATGVVFADLNNNGRLDLYVGSMPAAADSNIARRMGRPMAGSSLFRNDGEGRFTNISDGNGACPPAFGGRSVTVLDIDGNGQLDLLVGEDPIPGYNGSPTKSSRLFRNLGDLKFEDASRSVGLPADIPGLGVAAADVNNDGWPDLFLASSNGGNRLFLNDGKGEFYEAPGTRELFEWKDERGRDIMVCGIAMVDVNRNGRLDIVLGPHSDRPWLEPEPVRLFLNRGIENGVPRFEEVTEQAGLIPLPLKAPHVEIQDFDNDGWPDIYTSIVTFDSQRRPHPVIFRHLGINKDGVPRFEQTALDQIDFPTAEDKAISRSGPFFDKVIAEGKIIYMAPGPSGDFDNDGRLDLFLPNWWTESPSLLLRNETPAGNWLQVQVEGSGGVNRMGIGARVNVYPAGKLGEKSALLGGREIATGYGYASGQPAIAHFGLGQEQKVDVEVILPHGKGRREQQAVDANQRITVK